MTFRLGIAKALSSVSTWGLKTIMHRPAGNFPGKIALYADPNLFVDLRSMMREGSALVVGTNGKTTTTALIAGALEAAGKRVIWNRTGANLDSGIATALLQSKPADWGVFEIDELWLAKVLPQMQCTYVVLLDLFPDQGDRMSVEDIQRSIIGGLRQSPTTTLVYNGDDPNCEVIAHAVDNPCLAFGVAEPMGLAAMAEHDEPCRMCGATMDYALRQYDQLGDYRCPNEACGFARPQLACSVHEVELDAEGLAFAMRFRQTSEKTLDGRDIAYAEWEIGARLSGAYMVYNLAAFAFAARLMGCSMRMVQDTIDRFNPRNGRLETLTIQGKRTLVNLAKNPAGFNQNLRIILSHEGPFAAAFFVNNHEGDGFDPSWIADVDFEALAERVCAGQGVVFGGGMVQEQLLERMRQAGLDVKPASTAHDVFVAIADMPADTRVYLIANYTALPPIHAEAEAMADEA